jgi:hypothetical protein
VTSSNVRRGKASQSTNPQLFVNTRSVSSAFVITVLRQLYADFPSSDPVVRLVLLLTVFLSDNCLIHTTPSFLKSKLEPLGLLPLTRRDIYNALVNPFIERSSAILEFAMVEVELKEKEVDELLEEVAVKCLEIGCKVCLTMSGVPLLLTHR